MSFLLIQSLVLIGDSLTCGSFGSQLFNRLHEQTNHVTVYCAVSSAPTHWLNGSNPKNQICQTYDSTHPKIKPCNGDGRMITFESIVKSHPGSKFMIALGTNSLASVVPDKTYEKLAELARSQSECTWIGPPHMNPVQSRGFSANRVAMLEKNLDPFYEGLQEGAARYCSLWDSRPATESQTPGFQTIDGVHRTQAAGTYWADFFFSL